MHQREHENRCLGLLGEPFPEVHEWLDRYFRKYGDLSHRLILHHRLGVELAGVLMGPKAREAARLHVLDDMRRLAAGPEEHMRLPHYLPRRDEEHRLKADMSAELGYVPDFTALFAGIDRRLKCGCGYPGPMRKERAALEKGLGPWRHACPWCGALVAYGRRNPAPAWPDAPGIFDILRELAVGSRFRKGLPEELRRIVVEGGTP